MWPFNRGLEKKEHPHGLAYLDVPQWSPRENRREAFIRDGYQRNAVIYRAIREITTAASAIKIEVHKGDDVLADHPALAVLASPNPRQAWSGLVTELLTQRCLLGESAALGAGGPRYAEIWPILPLEVKIEPGIGGLPAAYVHERKSKKMRFEVDPDTGQSQLFFNKLYNPDDYWRGQSPLMAAAVSADTHNAGSAWNYSLLRNGARPSGLVRFKGAYPSGERIAQMREFFKRTIQGSANAGEIPMLSDDAEWVELSKSPKDMDFSKTMAETAKLIASVLGVPLPLVDNDASTFNNLEQAKERLYTDTVIPMLNDLLSALGQWMLPAYGEGLRFALDLDSIPALEGVRERKYKRALDGYTAGVLTIEETRELIGYDAAPSGTLKPAAAPVQGKSLLARLAYG